MLEAVALGGHMSPEARIWRERMTADLVSPNVSELLRELHRHKAQAAEALRLVCLLLPAPVEQFALQRSTAAGLIGGSRAWATQALDGCICTADLAAVDAKRKAH